jgi:hypothetical protein
MSPKPISYFCAALTTLKKGVRKSQPFERGTPQYKREKLDIRNQKT